MKINNVEEWRAVKGFEGRYEVSNLGRVKSLERTVTSKNHYGTFQRRVREKMLKLIKNSEGYLQVDLSKNGTRKQYLVHRLVAEAFIPNPYPEKYDVVNHKIEGAEGKLINTVENLEWCDTLYNFKYGTARERMIKTQTNRSDLSKTVYQYNTAHELVGKYPSAKEVQRQTGFAQQNISACCNGKRKTAYNYVWSYEQL